MLLKTMLFATAAALVATSANAADAVVEPAPVAANFVKVCDTFGAGYFYIPGSDTCLKISGRIRVTAGYDRLFTYNTNTGVVLRQGYASAMLTDGRVEFGLAQSTDFGSSISAIRFKASDGTLTVDEAYISVGDISVGQNIKDTTIFDQETYGEMSLYLNANAYGDTVGNAIHGPGRLESNAVGARLDHAFGGGVTASLGVTGPTTPWIISDSSVAGDAGKPIVQGSVTYSSGAIKSLTLAAAYDSANQSNGGGYGTVLSGEYALTDALSAMGGVGFTRTLSRNYATVAAALKYKVDPRLQIYGGAAYLYKQAVANSVWANLGVAYQIAPKLTLIAEEEYQYHPTYRNYLVSSDWTSMVRLKREF